MLTKRRPRTKSPVAESNTGGSTTSKPLARCRVITRPKMGSSTRGNKVLSLGQRVNYPITITKLYKSTGDRIKNKDPLIQYSQKYRREEFDSETNEYKTVEDIQYSDWNSPADGKLVQWHLKVGELVRRDTQCAIVEEDCTHEVQFHGMCGMCGKDMTEHNWAADKLDTERAPINMVHDQTNLLVSRNAALKAELELQKRLLDQRKLVLVVDLDQTIIHACIEPTIGDWQRDPSNPNHESVKDVKSFQLNDDGPRGLASGCWYYIKMRPGLVEFLEKIATMYELHVYTMGTRAYAMNIAKIVDPDKKLFGNRVISRDENGNMTAKSLQRLFPASTKMVVIIDDRADVWPRNRPNLIKVVPYDFFKGIGDINSSFLPKRDESLAPSTPSFKVAAVNGNKPGPQSGASPSKGGAKVSAMEELVSMGGGDLKKQTEEQAKTLEKQITDRPLLHMQEQLDKEDNEAAKKEEKSGGEVRSMVLPHHPRHQLLLDDDRELNYLEEHLTQLHEAFYREYDAKVAAEKKHPGKHSRSASPLPGSKVTEEDIDPPDVGTVLDDLKVKVLEGTRIVLSGLVPIGVDVEQSEIGLQASSFGAEILRKVTPRVTHLVVSSGRPRTLKVTQAEKIPSIKIVNQDWLISCLSQWRRVEEAPYSMGRSDAERAALASAAMENTDTEMVSDADVETDGGNPNGKMSKLNRPRIVISKPNNTGADEGEESDDEMAPGSPIEQLSNFDWGAADEDLAAFLNEDDDEDDDDDEQAYDDSGSTTSEASETDSVGRPAKSGQKRSRGTDSEDESRLSDSERGKKKLKVAFRSSSKLREVRVPGDADEDKSGLPTPHVTGDEDEMGSQPVNGNQASVVDINGDEDDDDDFDMEAEMMAELERAQEDEDVEDDG